MLSLRDARAAIADTSISGRRGAQIRPVIARRGKSYGPKDIRKNLIRIRAIPRLIEKPKNCLTGRSSGIRLRDVIRGGFLSADDRRALIGIARDGLAEARVARRANAIVLLDRGWSCERVAAALLLDDDTVRDW